MAKHPNHEISYINRDFAKERGADRLAAWSPRRIVKSAFGKAASWALRQAVSELGQVPYRTNDDVKQAWEGSFNAMTVTNLHSLATSATAGWQSASVDWSSTLYLDALFTFFFTCPNTAPANSLAFFLLAGHQIDGSTWTTPFSGSEGTCTYISIIANAICPSGLGTVPYAVANDDPRRTVSFNSTLNGTLPMAGVVGVINNSGCTLSASGSTVGNRGTYITVI